MPIVLGLGIPFVNRKEPTNEMIQQKFYHLLVGKSCQALNKTSDVHCIICCLQYACLKENLQFFIC